MIQLQNISKSYGSQELFEQVSLQMQMGERLGLAGRNGHGKSTLFKIILGQEEADSGSIVIPKGYRLGHLEQHLKFSQPNILSEACLGLPEEEKELTYKAEIILMGLGFSQEDFQKAPAQFSGGYQIRINLAKLLLSAPNLLLLDEPTNYLDILSIRWLTQFLRNWEHELIIISHDRDLMDSITTHTALIHRQRLKKVQGSTQKLYAQVAQEEEIYEKTRLNEAKKRKQEEAFIERFRSKASKASLVQSRIKQLQKRTQFEALKQIQSLDFEFHCEPIEANRLLQVHSLNFHYEPTKPLIDALSFTVKKGDCIGVIGKNGKGKSTLLKLIAQELHPLNGEIKTHPNLKMGYFGQTNIQRLNETLTIEQEIQNSNPDLTLTEVRSIAGCLLFSGDQVLKRIKVLSGGEKSRVLLAKILANPSNLLLLDEPTNHLDLESIEALIEAIQVFEGGSLIVTHSEMILRQLATQLIVFTAQGVQWFDGTYDEFLEKIGWEDEIESQGSSNNANRGNRGSNKKELRQKRSEIVAEKSKLLSPLKKQIETTESQIATLEKALESRNQELIAVTQNPAQGNFVEISKSIKTLKGQIEQAYARWENLSHEHQMLQQKYEELLKE